MLVSFLSVSSFSWYLGRAAVCDYGIPWTFLLSFFFFFFFFFFFLVEITLTHLCRCPIRGTWANSVDPVQPPHNAAFDQGLHCIKYRTIYKTW